jgi:hypothetical protein
MDVVGADAEMQPAGEPQQPELTTAQALQAMAATLSRIEAAISALAATISRQTGAITAAIDRLGDRLDRRIDAAHSESFRLSEITKGAKVVILRKLSLTERKLVGPNLDELEPLLMPEEKYYKWLGSKEEEQAHLYKQHLIFQFREMFFNRLVRVEHSRSAWKLNQKLPLHQLELHGLADLMVIRAGHPKDLASVHVAIETKKTKAKTKNQPPARGLQDIVDAGSTKGQAIGQLIALDLSAKGPVVVVATDLRDSWTFFWLSLCPASARQRKREVHWLPLKHLKLGIETLKEILCGADTLTYANFSCECNEPYSSHLTKFCEMELAEAELLAENARLTPPEAAPTQVQAQVQEDVDAGGATRMDTRYGVPNGARLHPRSCAAWLQPNKTAGLRAD